jgi:hypothetical protein
VNHSSRSLNLRDGGRFENHPLRDPALSFDEAFDDRYSNFALYGEEI